MLFENRSISSVQRIVAESALSFRERIGENVCPSADKKLKYNRINRAENLEKCEIRINTHTHTHNRPARQYTEYSLIIKELAGLSVREYPAFPPENHTIDTVAPSPPGSCLRRERRALSGGMRYMVLPCPYAAGVFYPPMSNRMQIR